MLYSYAHCPGSGEHISWSLMANCSRDKYLKEHLKQQLEQYPNPELKVYLDQIAHKQATSKLEKCVAKPESPGLELFKTEDDVIFE